MKRVAQMMLVLFSASLVALATGSIAKTHKLDDGIVVESQLLLSVSKKGNLLWGTKELEFGRTIGILHLHPYRSVQTNYLSASHKDSFTWVFGMVGKQGFFEAKYFESGIAFTVQANSDEVAGLVELATALRVRGGRPRVTDESFLKLIVAGRSDYSLDCQPLVSDDVFERISLHRWERPISLRLDGTTLSLKKLHLLSRVELDEISICRVPFDANKIHQVSLLNPKALFLRRNLLTEADVKKLKNFRRLQYLDLSFNRIESMDVSYPSLAALRISGNPMRNLKFAANNRLDELIADGCELKPESFRGQVLANLTTLNLSYSNLRSGLKNGWPSFSEHFPRVQELDLRGNKLESTSLVFLSGSKTLQEVDLRDNPLIRDLAFLRHVKSLKKVSLDIQAFRNSKAAGAVLKSLPLLRVVQLDFDDRELEPILPKLENVEYEFRN